MKKYFNILIFSILVFFAFNINISAEEKVILNCNYSGSDSNGSFTIPLEFKIDEFNIEAEVTINIKKNPSKILKKYENTGGYEYDSKSTFLYKDDLFNERYFLNNTSLRTESFISSIDNTKLVCPNLNYVYDINGHSYNTYIIFKDDLDYDEEIKNVVLITKLTKELYDADNSYQLMHPAKLSINNLTLINESGESISSDETSVDMSEAAVQSIYRIPNFISTEVGTCMDLLGEEIANYIQVAFTIIKIGSIIVLIVYSMIDFVKSITEKEEDLIVKVKKFGKRLILLIIILIMPAIIDSFGNLAGYPDILCGIK